MNDEVYEYDVDKGSDIDDPDDLEILIDRSIQEVHEYVCIQDTSRVQRFILNLFFHFLFPIRDSSTKNSVIERDHEEEDSELTARRAAPITIDTVEQAVEQPAPSKIESSKTKNVKSTNSSSDGKVNVDRSSSVSERTAQVPDMSRLFHPQTFHNFIRKLSQLNPNYPGAY